MTQLNMLSTDEPQASDMVKPPYGLSLLPINTPHTNVGQGDTYTFSSVQTTTDWEAGEPLEAHFNHQDLCFAPGVFGSASEDLMSLQHQMSMWGPANANFCFDGGMLPGQYLQANFPGYGMAAGIRETSWTVAPLDSVASIERVQRKAGSDMLQSESGMPTAAQLENHWAQAHSQAHVEHWLEQKVNEESSAPRNPELNLQPEDTSVIETNPVSQRRRVKFDFSSLIDGPPTLSAPPTEVIEDEGEHHRLPYRQDLPRPRRSLSRHSTSSRMSFSDINSISSALTSMSIKDSDSRRGSIYSAGSERNLEDESDEEGSGEVIEVAGDDDYDDGDDDDKESDKSTGSTGSEESADGESIDWEEWLVEDNEATLMRKELQMETVRRQLRPVTSN
jgi:hypothetical protein